MKWERISLSALGTTSLFWRETDLPRTVPLLSRVLWLPCGGELKDKVKSAHLVAESGFPPVLPVCLPIRWRSVYFNPPWPFGVGSLRRCPPTSARLLRAGMTHTSVRAGSLTSTRTEYIQSTEIRKTNLMIRLKELPRRPRAVLHPRAAARWDLYLLKERAYVGEVRDLSEQVRVMES